MLPPNHTPLPKMGVWPTREAWGGVYVHGGGSGGWGTGVSCGSIWGNDNLYREDVTVRREQYKKSWVLVCSGLKDLEQ